MSDGAARRLVHVSFAHFRLAHQLLDMAMARDAGKVTDILAQSLGILAQGVFPLVTRCFLDEVKDLEPLHAIPLVKGMRRLRLKLYPVPDLDASFEFLRACASHFLSPKAPSSAKNTWALLFVDLLMPVVAVRHAC